MNIKNGCYHMVRPLFKSLNQNLKRFISSNHFSVHKSIILYYGRHGIKQSIKGKPKKYDAYVRLMSIWSMRSLIIEVAQILKKLYWEMGMIL